MIAWSSVGAWLKVLAVLTPFAAQIKYCAIPHKNTVILNQLKLLKVQVLVVSQLFVLFAAAGLEVTATVMTLYHTWCFVLQMPCIITNTTAFRLRGS